MLSSDAGSSLGAHGAGGAVFIVFLSLAPNSFSVFAWISNRGWFYPLLLLGAGRKSFEDLQGQQPRPRLERKPHEPAPLRPHDLACVPSSAEKISAMALGRM